MLELIGNIQHRFDGLFRTSDIHYFDKHDKDNPGNPKKKQPFVPSSTDEHAADIYAAILKKQENIIRLLNKMKEKLTSKVTTIAYEEVKVLVRVCAFDYCELASKVMGILFYEQKKKGSTFPLPKTNM